MLPFKVGDKVIYPNQGIGVIERVETRTIMGTTCGFYSLRMTSSETMVMVPVDNVEEVGLRSAVADNEVRRLFMLLGNGEIDNHQNWKGRFKDNSNKMRTGSLYDVSDVLKSLNHLSQSKNLSFREKRMLDRAKFLVVSELSEVTSEPTEEIEKRVNKALERCVANWKRRSARATAARSGSNRPATAALPTTVASAAIPKTMAKAVQPMTAAKSAAGAGTAPKAERATPRKQPANPARAGTVAAKTPAARSTRRAS